MNIDIKTLKVIRPKKRNVTDPVRFPKVTLKYEGQFKKDYVNMLQAMTMQIAQKMGEFV